MGRINRDELLQQLETVQPGLSPKEIVEQSNAFVFRDGEVQTFNDECACRAKCSLDITGAVQAKSVLEILHKMKEDTLDTVVRDNELIFTGKRRQLGLRLEQEILLKIDSIEQPTTWKKLPEDFIEAITLTHSCASRDESQPALGCVHVHPQWIEACNNIQLARFTIKTGLKEPILVRWDSLKHVINLDISEWARTETWLHFRNGSGLVLSCRRYMDDYPDLSPLLEVEGEQTTLPKGLGDAADRASVFSAENDRNEVLVELRPGKLRVRGQGITGWYTEVKDLKYSGSPISFLIDPKLLTELTAKHHECEMTADRLKVNGAKWTYVTCLGRPEDVNGHTDVASD